MSPEVRPRRLPLHFNDAERALWDADAQFLGFHHCGAAYIRFILNARVNGHLMLLDPSAARLFQNMGTIFGETVGNIIARMERAYLEGDK